VLSIEIIVMLNRGTLMMCCSGHQHAALSVTCTGFCRHETIIKYSMCSVKTNSTNHHQQQNAEVSTIPLRRMRECRYSPSFLTRHQLAVSGELHASAGLLLGKDPPVLKRQEAGWTPAPVWTLYRRERSPVPSGNRNPAV
jgi:hypothetical protein